MGLSELPIDIERHNAEIHENRRHWERKPALREVYSEFYKLIAHRLKNLPPGPVLECGSGIGNIKSVLPDAITSDLFPNPWLDRQENIYSLSYKDNSLSAIVLFDVFHHLEFPGTALLELQRVLVPGGRLIIFEPAMGLLGRIVLGLFHHEPLALKSSIQWSAPQDFDPRQHQYYAAQGNAWRIFIKDECPNLGQFAVVEINTKPALPWLLTGGFRGNQLGPGWVLFVAECVERALALAPRLFASRMLVVLEKHFGTSTT